MATGNFAQGDFGLGWMSPTFRQHEQKPGTTYGTYHLTHADMNNVQNELKRIWDRILKLGMISVLDFNPPMNGVDDDAPAFNAACNKAKDFGGVVIAPPNPNGWVFKTMVTVPRRVDLVGGVFGDIPKFDSNSQLYSPTNYSYANLGATIKVYGGKGNILNSYEGGVPAIFLRGGGSVRGFSFFYPEQVDDVNNIKLYPPTIEIDRDYSDSLVENCAFVNPYIMIKAPRAHGRMNVRNVIGQPLFRGISTDQSWDVDRIDNVQIWPYWTHNDPNNHSGAMRYAEDNCIAYDILKADEIMLTKVFAYGCYSGMKVSKGTPDMAYGKLDVFGFDYCKFPLLFDGTGAAYGGQTQGWQISNGGIIPLNHWSGGGNAIKVTNYGSGRINTNNISVWGRYGEDNVNRPSHSPVYMDSGNLTATALSIVDWGDTTKPAIDLYGSARFKMGFSEIAQDGTHIRCASGVPNPIVAYNDIKTSTGGLRKTVNGQTVIGESTNRFYT